MHGYPDGPDPTEERSLLRIQARVAWFMRILTTVDVGERPPAPPGPAIHAANHRSMADLLLSTCTFSTWGWPIRPLVAVSYFERPLIGWLLRKLRCIPVEGTEALDLAAEALRDGWSIAIMPEGRIVPEEEWAETGVGRSHLGIGRLAMTPGFRWWPTGPAEPKFSGLGDGPSRSSGPGGGYHWCCVVRWSGWWSPNEPAKPQTRSWRRWFAAWPPRTGSPEELSDLGRIESV